MILFDDVAATNKLVLYPEYIKFSSDLNSMPQPIKNNEINIVVDMSCSPLLRECKHFIECCETRTQPITNGEEGLRVLKVLNYLQESLINNKEIVLSNTIEFPQYNNVFIHETAIVDRGAIIGEGTKIWHYSHICKGAVIGKEL